MIILLRHANDEDTSQTFAHDFHVQKNEMYLAKRTGKKLRRRYGVPHHIFTSPFRRTIATAKVLRGKYETQIHVTKDLGRYFTTKNRKKPDVSPETLAYGVDPQETKEMFRERIRLFCRNLSHKREIIWLVTHAYTFKRIAKELGHEYVGKIDFLQFHTFP